MPFIRSWGADPPDPPIGSGWYLRASTPIQTSRTTMLPVQGNLVIQGVTRHLPKRVFLWCGTLVVLCDHRRTTAWSLSGERPGAAHHPSNSSVDPPIVHPDLTYPTYPNTTAPHDDNSVALPKIGRVGLECAVAACESGAEVASHLHPATVSPNVRQANWDSVRLVSASARISDYSLARLRRSSQVVSREPAKPDPIRLAAGGGAP